MRRLRTGCAGGNFCRTRKTPSVVDCKPGCHMCTTSWSSTSVTNHPPCVFILPHTQSPFRENVYCLTSVLPHVSRPVARYGSKSTVVVSLGIDDESQRYSSTTSSRCTSTRGQGVSSTRLTTTPRGTRRHRTGEVGRSTGHSRDPRSPPPPDTIGPTTFGDGRYRP